MKTNYIILHVILELFKIQTGQINILQITNKKQKTKNIDALIAGQSDMGAKWFSLDKLCMCQ